MIEKGLTITEWADLANKAAVKRGFSQDTMPRNIKNDINHMHSEVNELFDALLLCREKDIEDEFSDIIIITLSLSKKYRIDIEQAMIKKHAYNMVRED